MALTEHRVDAFILQGVCRLPSRLVTAFVLPLLHAASVLISVLSLFIAKLVKSEGDKLVVFCYDSGM